MDTLRTIGHNQPPEDLSSPPSTGIAVYEPFRAELATLKAQNMALSFDYESPKGNKEARSHIYKLRQSKAAVEKARKAEKAASLEYGRRVDAEAKSIMDEIEALISVHAEPLEAIEQREQARISGIQERISIINGFGLCTGWSAEQCEQAITELRALEINEDFSEFQAQACQAKETALIALESARSTALQREAEQAELERLRSELAEREQRERDEKLKAEAAEAARLEAEAKAEQERRALEARLQEERDAAAKRELELQLEAERAQREKAEAERRRAEAVQAERARFEQEAQAKAAAAAKREADERHQAQIHADIAAGLLTAGITESQAAAVISAIREGRVPHVNITY